MCGRYTITETPQRLAERFRAAQLAEAYPPRYNAAPTQLLPVIVQGDDGSRSTLLMRWGLIPSWAKDPSIGNRMINARAETVASKPSFRAALKSRRCLVPADGFYEWEKTASGKTPMRVTTESREMFAFAGLWERWTSAEGETVLSFTIITVDAAGPVKRVHHRMPLILHADQEDRWLDVNTDASEIQAILRNTIADSLELSAVSTRVNSARNDDPSLIRPM